MSARDDGIADFYDDAVGDDVSDPATARELAQRGADVSRQPLSIT